MIADLLATGHNQLEKSKKGSGGPAGETPIDLASRLGRGNNDYDNCIKALIPAPNSSKKSDSNLTEPLSSEQKIPSSQQQPSALDKKEEKISIESLCSLVRSGNLNRLKELQSLDSKHFGEMLNKRSPEGLTVTEYAIIENQDKIFAFLASIQQYDSKSDGVFSIIPPNKIKALLTKYNDAEYSHLTLVLQTVLDKYNDNTENTKD